MNNTGCMLFQCQDNVGIVAKISRFFAERKLNIETFEQTNQEGEFFARISWTDNNPIENKFNKEKFSREFQNISKDLSADFSIYFDNEIQSLGLFVSQNPKTLLEIISKIALDDFPSTKINFIISNHKNSSSEIAKKFNIPFYYIPTKNREKIQYEKEQLEIIKKYSPDLIGLARYMRILSANFIDSVNCPIINIHHSFLPSFVGANPYEDAYHKGVKLIGATSHFVTPELDQGPIIEQDVIRIRSSYKINELKKLGGDVEKKVFSTAIQKALEHKILVYKNRTIIFE